MKRTIIALLLLISAFLFIACGDEAPDTGSFTVEFDEKNKTAEITGYTAKDEKIAIPEKFGKYTVTSIGRNAFKENYDVSEIEFPKTLKTVGTSAFELCVSLKEIKLPDSLERIDNTAFANCRKLEYVYIPEKVNTVGICAFTGCTSLETIEVSENNPNYASDEYGVLFNKEQTELIQYPLGSDTDEYDIPETVTVIKSYAFEKANNLETVNAGSALKTVESYAFQASDVRKITFSDGLETIGNFAFNESKLNEIELGNTVKSIGDSAFSWCTSLKEVNIPSSVETVGTSAFYMCTSVKKYSVGENNTFFKSDENGVLFDKDMKTLLYYPNAREENEYTIPTGVVTVATRAFSPSLGLSKITVPDTVETIEEYAFAQCSNLKETVYEGTKPQNIADNAFEA